LRFSKRFAASGNEDLPAGRIVLCSGTGGGAPCFRRPLFDAGKRETDGAGNGDETVYFCSCSAHADHRQSAEISVKHGVSLAAFCI
jgi:hypothetical protein